ncbi:hypothetical protein DWY31_05565 [Dorea sp. AF24-7LB]|nr:hypothetical protein DWY31_05565 [Dorea sp. AF24-7LB]
MMFRGFMNKLRLGVTIIVALFIISGICGVLGVTDVYRGNSILEKIGMLIMTAIFVGIMYIIIYYWYGKDNRCPSCKNHFA